MVTMDFPATASLLIRLDYSDDEAWTATLRATSGPGSTSGHLEALTVVEDPELDGMPVDELVEQLVAADSGRGYVFVADSQTLDEPEHPILAIALPRGGGEPFGLRVAPAKVAEVEANLATGNLGLEEIAEAADTDGVYREIRTPTKVVVRVSQILSAMVDGPSTPVLDEFRVALERNPGPDEHETRPLDMREVYEDRSRRPTSYYAEYWDVFGEDEYREALQGGGAGLGFSLYLPNQVRWDAVLDPVTFRPVGAARWAKRPPRSARRT
ncbi:hypothetical protein Q3O43_30000 (plasmid) [Rhodococcus aetherivorans]|uniref:DUF6924 domain-containing protein n=1 Tax=Rhodococcus aetherivorans TaxID=191292 RepID=UPI0026E99D9B|nr:hypothetical protein [Rhodococcus aetherivorans]WKX02132.1 hypothetical protein Q3O43_30000 [Rhodococcus aetherivorans]